MQQLITQLLNDVQKMQNRYETVKSKDIDYDFYKDVVPFTSYIDNLLETFSTFEPKILRLSYMNKKNLIYLFQILNHCPLNVILKGLAGNYLLKKSRQYNTI